MSSNNSALLCPSTSLANFPAELKALRIWVCYRNIGQRTGVPFIAGTDKHASSTNPDDWTDFATACEALAKGTESGPYDGLSCAIVEPYVCIDLDRCVINGASEPWAKDLIAEIGKENAYIEWSRSKTGLHSWVKGSLPQSVHRGRFEAYGRDKFMVATGNVMPGTGTIRDVDLSAIAARADTIDPDHRVRAPKRAPGERRKISRAEWDATMYISERKLEDLHEGNWHDHYPGQSQSDADYGFINMLIRKHYGDYDKVEAAFEASGMYRPYPAKSKDYVSESIKKALNEMEVELDLDSVDEEAEREEEYIAWLEEQEEEREDAYAAAYYEKVEPESQPLEDMGHRTENEQAEPRPKPTRNAFTEWLADKKRPRPTPNGKPVLAEAALYGVAGDIVRKLMPHTEGHPAGILADVLTRFGNIIGRTVYYKVEDTRHYGNLFIIKVGESSMARKGTAGDRVTAIFEKVNEGWSKHNILQGLSSGEGLIHEVRDPVYKDVINEKTGKIHRECVDEGVKDQRKLVFDGEFGQTLAVLQRDGNTLSPVMRNAWDGKTLRTTTKHSPDKSSKALISVVSDITRYELLLKMTLSDQLNGFANRFLWIHVERTKELPHGGGDLDWSSETKRLQKAVMFATHQLKTPVEVDAREFNAFAEARIYMDRNARDMWGRVYGRLTESQPGGFGNIVSRGAPQVVRLAMLYALLDECDHIGTEHLKAALALWDYCEQSARFIFNGLTPEQRKILDFLAEKPKTRTEISKECFKGNRKAELITADLDGLTTLGKVKKIESDDGKTTRYKAA